MVLCHDGHSPPYRSSSDTSLSWISNATLLSLRWQCHPPFSPLFQSVSPWSMLSLCTATFRAVVNWIPVWVVSTTHGGRWWWWGHVPQRTNSFATALVQLTQWEDEREVEKRRSDAGPEMRSRDSMSSVPLDAHPLTAGSVRDAEDAAHCHLSAVCAVDFREIFFAIPS